MQRARRQRRQQRQQRQRRPANARGGSLGGRLPWADRLAPPAHVSLGLAAAVPLAIFVALQPDLVPALGALVAGFAAGRLSD